MYLMSMITESISGKNPAAISGALAAASLKIVCLQIVSGVEKTQEMSNSEQSHMELDSHANIPVVEKNAIALSEMGRTHDDDSAFTLDYEPNGG